MSSTDDRELEPIDRELERLFAADQQVPVAFTTRVLRRVREADWNHEAFLERVLRSGLVVIAALMIVATWISVSALAAALQTDHVPAAGGAPFAASLSGATAMKIAIAGMTLTALATWWRLSRALEPSVRRS
jgi:hypothetical protein